VTGGAKRIGRVLCLELARLGFAVAIHYRGSADDAEMLADEIKSGGGSAATISAICRIWPPQASLLNSAHGPFLHPTA